MVKDWLHAAWKLLLVRGILSVIFGIIVIAMPDIAILTFAIVWGIWALVEGFASIAQAVAPESKGTGRGWLIFLGIIGVLAGVLTMIHPGATALTLTWLITFFIGVWLIVRGITELAGGFAASAVTPRWLLIVGAVLSIVLGVLFLTSPGGAALTLLLWLGILTIMWGVVMIVTAFQARSAAKRDADA